MPRPIQTALTRAIAQGTADRALPRVRDRADRLNGQLATGLRIRRPSDDPAGFARAKALGQLQDRLAQHTRGIDVAQLWVDRTQTELDALADVFASAYETGLRAANGILDGEDLARQVESARAEATVRLNATSGGEYLFAGNQTTTRPVDDAGAVAAGDFSGARRREVAPGVTLAVNTVGALEVGGVSAPDRLQALADAIRSGDPAAMRTATEDVRAGVDHYARLGGRNGATSRQLTQARVANEAQDVLLGERRAAIEEVDLAEVLGASQRQQTALEAALRATATSVQTSIMNYLR